MTSLSRIKKYFNYDDRLRRIVSIVTGVFIAFFNALSGYMVIQILSYLILGVSDPGILIQILFVIPSLISGTGVFLICIFIIELFLGKIDVEEYSYLRLVLLFSIAAYLIILIIYSSVFISDEIMILIH